MNAVTNFIGKLYQASCKAILHVRSTPRRCTQLTAPFLLQYPFENIILCPNHANKQVPEKRYQPSKQHRALRSPSSSLNSPLPHYWSTKQQKISSETSSNSQATTRYKITYIMTACIRKDREEFYKLIKNREKVQARLEHLTLESMRQKLVRNSSANYYY